MQLPARDRGRRGLGNSGGAPGTRPDQVDERRTGYGRDLAGQREVAPGHRRPSHRVGGVHGELITRLTRRPFVGLVRRGPPRIRTELHSERSGARGRATLTENVGRRLALAPRAVSNQPRHGRSRTRGLCARSESANGPFCRIAGIAIVLMSRGAPLVTVGRWCRRGSWRRER